MVFVHPRVERGEQAAEERMFVTEVGDVFVIVTIRLGDLLVVVLEAIFLAYQFGGVVSAFAVGCLAIVASAFHIRRFAFRNVAIADAKRSVFIRSHLVRSG